jgi:hypothetical protein
MAVTPISTPLNVPDLVGYARQLKEQERERQNQLAEYLGKFTKRQGQLLDGVRPEVQKAWNDVENLSIDLEMNDTPSGRTALGRAYQNYSELAGAGVAYTNSILKETTSAMADPSKFNLGGRNARDIYSQYNTESLSADEIISRASQPFVLDRRIDYKVTNPTEFARKLRKDWDESAQFSFIDPKTGKYNEQDRLNWIRETTAATLREPDSQKNAAIWSGLTRRQLGSNGEITDYNEVDGIMDNPLYNEWVSAFQREVENYTDLIVPEASVSPFEARQDALNRNKGGSDFMFGDGKQTLHAPFERQLEEGKSAKITMRGLGTNIEQPTAPKTGTEFQALGNIYSGSRQITSFGKKNDGTIYVSYKQGEDDASNVFEDGASPAFNDASAQDKAALQQYLVSKNDPRTYNFLFGNDVSSGRATGAGGAGIDADRLRATYIK